MVGSNTKVVIYQGNAITVYIDRVTPSKVVFSFTGYEGSPGDTNFYGDGFIQKAGFTAVFFVSTENHWWQSSELPAAIAAANEATREHENRIAYGQSMGGFGALLCSARLRARAVVTAPQTTVDPARAPIGEEWLAEIGKRPVLYPDVIDEVSRCSSTLVMYDPKGNSDRHHLALIRHLPGVRWLQVPYSTHNLPRTLREMGVLSQVVESAFASCDVKERNLRSAIQPHRLNSLTYVNTLTRRLKIARSAWVYPQFQKILAQHIKAKSHYPEAHEVRESPPHSQFSPKLEAARRNGHVEIIDKKLGIYKSVGNDPQLVWDCTVDPSVHVVSFRVYSSVESSAHLYFSRKSRRGFTHLDMAKFAIKAGLNDLRTTVDGAQGEIVSLRLDPLSCKGIFRVF